MSLKKEGIAQRIAQDLQDGWYVNLGIGIPTLVANYVPDGMSVEFQSENGILGMGPFPYAGEEDPDLINAGKQTVTLLPGASIFDSAMSFAMIRGGHIDVSLLGAYEVAANGDIANWHIPGPRPPAVGGAMDLAAGAKKVWAMLSAHVSKNGAPKVVERCTLPLTGVGCVNRVYSDLAVIDIDADGLLVTAMVEGLTRKARAALIDGEAAYKGGEIRAARDELLRALVSR